MQDEINTPGVIFVRLEDELQTPLLQRECRRQGWALRHKKVNMNVHWVNVPPGTEHDAIATLLALPWVLSAKRSTRLRLL